MGVRRRMDWNKRSPSSGPALRSKSHTALRRPRALQPCDAQGLTVGLLPSSESIGTSTSPHSTSPLFPCTAFFVLVLLALSVPAQSTEVGHGVEVVSVDKNSEAERAGLAEGDVILSWSRADVRGEIESPFDWSDLLAEQGPRGSVLLRGIRFGRTKTWSLGLKTWGLTVQPNLQPRSMTTFRTCRRLGDSSNRRQSERCWLSMLSGLRSTAPRWLRPFLLCQLAESLTKQERWLETDRTYREAVEWSRPAGRHITAQVLEAWGVATRARGDLTQASEHFSKALAIRETLTPDSLGVAKVLDYCGDVAREHDDLSKAEGFYLRAKGIRDSLAPDSLATAGSLSSIGYLAWARGDLAKADGYNRQALALREKLAPDSLLVAASLVPIGLVAWRRGELDEAEKDIGQAHDIYTKLSPDSYNVSATLQNLALLAWSRGDLGEAEEDTRLALAVQQKLEPASLDVADNLSNLAMLAEERGDLIGAELYQRRALAIRQKHSARTGIAQSLFNIGQIALDRSDRGKAEKCLLQALAIQEETVPNSEFVAETLSAIGSVDRQNGDTLNAEQHYLRALAIEEKLAPRGLSVAMILDGLGRIARDRGDDGKAEEYFRQALSIRKWLAPETAEYAESLAALGGVMRDEQYLDSATEMLGQALNPPVEQMRFLDHIHRELDVHRSLERVAIQLSITLLRMRITQVQQRSRVHDGQIHGRALANLIEVHVAAPSA